MAQLSDYIDRPEVRAQIVLQFSKAHLQNWQDVATPVPVVKGMVGLVPVDPELLWVVLFNLEFLEELIYCRGVDKAKIVFMADNSHEAGVAMGVYGVKTFELPQTVRDPAVVINLLAVKISIAFYQGGPMPKTNNLVVVGNPPYQATNNREQRRAASRKSGAAVAVIDAEVEEGGRKTSHATPIFHLFVESTLDHLNPRYLSFILPSRWMNGGRGLDSHRRRMMSDKHIRSMKHFPGSSEIFKKVEIKGGVNYFLWDREYSGKCCFNGKHRHLDEYKEHDIILVDGEASSILDKVLDLHRGKNFLDKTCLPQTPFGLVSSWDSWCQESDAGALRCFAKGSNYKWVNTGYADPSGVLNKYKVVVSKANNGATNEDKDGKRRVIGDTTILGPQEICTQSYMVLKSFDTEVEASNFAAYAGTMFFRLLLGLHMSGQDVNSDKLGWVPDLGPYTAAATDARLFAQFGLTQDEIDYINKRIK